ncbi:aldose 1-epimerase [Flavihumibacter profundi]|uniref:aldose 1-epimerase n=1 Tax=Flavihumibacter profundi TaxID=2716883 RepID=UPI001CC62525|nr:aldose 1-epimerase [Flavihumibacter profundi]MBZ5857944.1 aldose 1-epimerase [Flavihumibacter profundi]
MSFRISHTVTNGIPLVNLHDDSRTVTASIVPDHGAMLHAFEVPLKNGPFNIMSNYQSAEEINRILNRSYRSSKLSPFACRIKNGQYTWGGQLYEFADKFPDGSAIHGLLFNKKFEVSNETVTDFMASADFTYKYNKDDPGYPFAYTCTIRYTLFPDQTLQLQTILKNDSDITIPMADGWHPYFRLNAPVNDCFLQFPSAAIVEFDDKLIPTGHTKPYSDYLTPKQLGETKLDNCFLLDENAGQPVCVFSNPAEGISLCFITDENYPYLQIYTPDDRASLAIENLSAAPDSFNNKMGLLLLDPGMEKAMTLHYQVKTGESA